MRDIIFILIAFGAGAYSVASWCLHEGWKRGMEDAERVVNGEQIEQVIIDRFGRLM